MFLSRLGTFVLLSVLLHFAFLTIVHFQNIDQNPKKDYVDLEIVIDQLPKKEDEVLGQVVDQDEKQLNDEIDKKSKFLSRHNQKVKKETKAVQHGKFKNQIGSPTTVTKQRPPQNTPSAEKYKGFKNGLPTLSSLTPNYNWNKIRERGSEATNDDHLKDVEKGIQTLLTTREFIYYTYYSRIKNQLSQYWEPKIKDKVTKLFRQGRKLAAVHDRITKVIITLDNTGTLIRVQVLEQSGVKDLDDAAIEAFRAAAPFPNPPKGIADSDGTIKIRWDFVLEV